MPLPKLKRGILKAPKQGRRMEDCSDLRPRMRQIYIFIRKGIAQEIPRIRRIYILKVVMFVVSVVRLCEFCGLVFSKLFDLPT